MQSRIRPQVISKCCRRRAATECSVKNNSNCRYGRSDLALYISQLRFGHLCCSCRKAFFVGAYGVDGPDVFPMIRTFGAVDTVCIASRNRCRESSMVVVVMSGWPELPSLLGCTRPGTSDFGAKTSP